MLPILGKDVLCTSDHHSKSCNNSVFKFSIHKFCTFIWKCSPFWGEVGIKNMGTCSLFGNEHFTAHSAINEKFAAIQLSILIANCLGRRGCIHLATTCFFLNRQIVFCCTLLCKPGKKTQTRCAFMLCRKQQVPRLNPCDVSVSKDPFQDFMALTSQKVKIEMQTWEPFE